MNLKDILQAFKFKVFADISWDDIMIAVNHIEATGNFWVIIGGGKTVEINGNTGMGDFEIYYDAGDSFNSKKEAVYNGIIAFVNWYAKPENAVHVISSEIDTEPEQVKESKAQIIKQMAEREGIPVVEVPLVNAPEIKDYKGITISDDQIKKDIKIILESNNGHAYKALKILELIATSKQLFIFCNWYLTDLNDGCIKYVDSPEQRVKINEAACKIRPLSKDVIWFNFNQALNVVLSVSFNVEYPVYHRISSKRMLEKVLEILEYKAN